MFELLRSYVPSHLSGHGIALAFLLAFLCGCAIANMYERTYRGLSWSPALVQTMVLGPLVSAMLMIAIGDNIAGAIGIVGSLAIIRFRTNLRDPRDMVFVFAALGAGIACGLLSFVSALVGTLAFCTAVWLLAATGFGTRRTHDGLLRFHAPADVGEAAVVALRREVAHFALVAMREVAQGGRIDYAYQVRLRGHDGDGGEERLLAALRAVAGIEGLSYHNQKTTVEI